MSFWVTHFYALPTILDDPNNCQKDLKTRPSFPFVGEAAPLHCFMPGYSFDHFECAFKNIGPDKDINEFLIYSSPDIPKIKPCTRSRMADPRRIRIVNQIKFVMKSNSDPSVTVDVLILRSHRDQSFAGATMGINMARNWLHIATRYPEPCPSTRNRRPGPITKLVPVIRSFRVVVPAHIRSFDFYYIWENKKYKAIRHTLPHLDSIMLEKKSFRIAPKRGFWHSLAAPFDEANYDEQANILDEGDLTDTEEVFPVRNESTRTITLTDGRQIVRPTPVYARIPDYLPSYGKRSAIPGNDSPSPKRQKTK